MFQKRSLPFELWLGRGRPLNPYLRGALIEFIRKETVPLELKLFPDERKIGWGVPWALYGDDSLRGLGEAMAELLPMVLPSGNVSYGVRPRLL